MTYNIWEDQKLIDAFIAKYQDYYDEFLDERVLPNFVETYRDSKIFRETFCETHTGLFHAFADNYNQGKLEEWADKANDALDEKDWIK